MFSNSFNITLKMDSKLLTIKPNCFFFNPDFNFKIRIVSRFIYDYFTLLHGISGLTKKVRRLTLKKFGVRR
jgi:hypothetical protein